MPKRLLRESEAGLKSLADFCVDCALQQGGTGSAKRSRSNSRKKKKDDKPAACCVLVARVDPKATRNARVNLPVLLGQAARKSKPNSSGQALRNLELEFKQA